MPKICVTKKVAWQVSKPITAWTGGKMVKKGRAQAVINKLRVEFAKNANKTNAAAMKKYMRGQYGYYGIKAPLRREICKKFRSETDHLDLPVLSQLLALLWCEPQREMQMYAMDLADKHKKTLSGKDEATCLQSMELVQSMLTTKSWWDTVDYLASAVIGHLVQQQPQSALSIMDAWIISDNMWLRRTAILHQLSYKKATDQARLFRYCEQCCSEEEFFIRKAIGWALRQYHRTNPKDVVAFVRANEDKLSKLSVREALKHAK